jgi:hypothetical protein
VVLGAASYPVSAVIHTTVMNGLDRAIYTDDFKTVCSIVILQRKDGDTWTDIVGCQLGRPTATVAIGPSLGRTVEIDPSSFHFASGIRGPAFGAGVYRVKFTCRFQPAAGGDDPVTVYSPEFTIH